MGIKGKQGQFRSRPLGDRKIEDCHTKEISAVGAHNVSSPAMENRRHKERRLDRVLKKREERKIYERTRKKKIEEKEKVKRFQASDKHQQCRKAARKTFLTKESSPIFVPQDAMEKIRNLDFEKYLALSPDEKEFLRLEFAEVFKLDSGKTFPFYTDFDIRLLIYEAEKFF